MSSTLLLQESQETRVVEKLTKNIFLAERPKQNGKKLFGNWMLLVDAYSFVGLRTVTYLPRARTTVVDYWQIFPVGMTQHYTKFPPADFDLVVVPIAEG